MKQPAAERISQWSRTHMKPPLGVVIAICVLPIVLVALFYMLRPMRDVMDWVTVYLSRPIRGFFAMLSSIYPVSLMEILCTAAGVFLIYYIIKAIRDSSRRREKWKLLGKRVLILLVAACYVYGAFCWLWSSGYHATGFAEKSGFKNSGVKTEDLIAVTQMFADKANELSALLERDEDGSLVASRSEMLAQSRYIYTNAAEQFPSLRGAVYTPKPMYFYSWLMTITGYTGIYFALTGEAMINAQQHAAYMPATVAHEMAHHLGVYAEDEANFAGILACVTSENPTFEYAGYVSGLNYLASALYRANQDEYTRIMEGLTFEVKLDRAQNYKFWAESRSSDIGVEWLDELLSSLMEKSNEAADAAYEGYLISQGQELGLQSYGACVDLLVEYFAP